MKTIRMLLALGALVAIAQSAFAVEVSVSDISVLPGETDVVATINVDHAKGIAGGDMTLIYNPEILTVKQVSTTELTTGMLIMSNLSVPGRVVISLAAAMGILEGSGPIVQILFDVNPEANPGTTDVLQLTDVYLSDEAANPIPVDAVVHGTVEVISGKAEWTVTIGLRRVAGGARIINALISLRAGDRAEFKATVTDQAGNPMDVPVTWKALGEAGTITSAGQFTASEQAGDRGSVIAQTEDGFSDTLSVNIIANMLQRMELVPESVALSVGERVTFKAQGYDAHGNPISVRPFWHIAGDVGTISGITGTFVAREVGVGYVVAFAQTIFGDAEAGVEGTAKVVVRAVPEVYALYPNIPNPFNSTTTIRYALPQASVVWLAVYTLNGQQVRVLDQEMREAGVYAKTWDGRDEEGREVSSGIYLVQLVASTHPKRPAFSAARRMVLVR